MWGDVVRCGEMEAASAACASRDEMPRSSPHSCRGGNQLTASSRVGVVTSYPHPLRREVKLCRVAPSWACLAEAQGTSPYISLHLLTSPYISLHLPIAWACLAEAQGT